MTTIAAWAERPQPIEATATIHWARQRFSEDSTVSALAVVEDGRPVGLVTRQIVMNADAGPLTAEGPVSSLMARPWILSSQTPPPEAFDAVLADGARSAAIVVSEENLYFGLITRASLLGALSREPQSEPRRAEERQHFIEMLGREIRTPMGGVLAVAELLQRQPLSADAQAFVQTIVDSSEGLLRLLDDALDLALGESGRLDSKPAPVHLRVTMDEIQAEWQARRSVGAAVLVSYDGDPDLGVLADGGRIKQIFANLIGAALKSTRQGAVEASLKARSTPEGVCLEGRVRDASPGLLPDQLARIFEPAGRAHDWSRAGWTGVGPALSRMIVEAMNGSIRADSNLGEGVTVTFELKAPLLEVEVSPSDNQSPLTHGGAIHVLVVDDNATNRMVAEGLCEMFDCTSECAEDGIEAVEAASSGRFDLILMDIKMPRMDGMEATRAIRALPAPINTVPIIALTANADPDDAKAYLACGMSSVVEKPIKPERLLMAMNAALGDGESSDSARAA